MKRFRDMRIRNKLFLLFIVLFVALIGLILGIINPVFYRSGVEKTTQNAQGECFLLKVQLEEMMTNLVTCTNLTTKDINLAYQDYDESDTGEVSFVGLRNSIYTAIDYNLHCFPEGASMIFVDRMGRTVSTSLPGAHQEPYVEEDMMNRIEDWGPPTCITYPIAMRQEFGFDEPVLTVGKRVIDMQTGENLGRLFLNVRESTFSDFFPEKENTAYAQEYFLLDEEGRYVGARDKQLLFQLAEPEGLREQAWEGGDGIVRIEGKPYLIISEPIPLLHVTLVSQISLRDLTKDIWTTTVIVIMIGILVSLVAMGFIYILSGLITQPIARLTNAAQRISEEDFTVRCTVTSRDEIGTLAGVFNRMVERIDKLITDVHVEQQAKRKYELALMQEQIKPHFLYNTLHLIYVFCEMNDPAGGGRIAKALGDYYRTSLSDGNSMITVCRELDIVSNYLLIQKERYDGLIDYTLEAEPQILGCRMLKLTLQPLVENAIYHGFKETEKRGLIQIRGYSDGEDLIFEVEDNGAGMDDAVIQKALACKEEGSGFGLYSVNQRIQLAFGKEYGLRIESEPGKGTMAVVKIPALGGTEDDKDSNCG